MPKYEATIGVIFDAVDEHSADVMLINAQGVIDALPGILETEVMDGPEEVEEEKEGV